MTRVSTTCRTRNEIPDLPRETVKRGLLYKSQSGGSGGRSTTAILSAKKKRKTTEAELIIEKQNNEKIEKKKKNKILNNLFNKTVQYSVVSSYVSVITELYSWYPKREKSPYYRYGGRNSRRY